MSLEQAFVAADHRLHDLKAFDCGKQEMNVFLPRFAIKHARLGLSRTFVLCEASGMPASKKSVAAYYTLTASTVHRSDIPIEQSLPRYPIPVILLARLAIRIQRQGSGLGSKALITALRHAVDLSRAGLPAHGLILDVLDEQALRFYQHFDLFKPFTDNPMRLFVSMKTLEQI